ncbi:MAG TPA: gamma carbonic anhydrase family protein [Actinomycetota bacterium]|nr:gamma carbonic anhydrase family protein [Actinomycetota bacterium]
MTGLPYLDRNPALHSTVFVAEGARVAGDVEIGEESSVWFNAVVRGDTSTVRIGARTNIQDGAVVHTDTGKPVSIGDDCTVGHNAVIHGCTVGNGCLIGMGAIVLSGAVVGDESLIAAGALVPEGKEFAARSLLVGSPAKLVRTLSDEEVGRLIRRGVGTYLRLAREYSSNSTSSERGP